MRHHCRQQRSTTDSPGAAAGQRFGVMDEFQPAPTAQQQQHGGGSLNGGGGGGGVPVLPDDVDVEEQRMLMAAIQGGGYDGHIPGARPGLPARRACRARAAVPCSRGSLLSCNTRRCPHGGLLHHADFSTDPRYQPRELSPGAHARQILREEQVGALPSVCMWQTWHVHQ